MINLFFDLEETLIKSWQDPLLCNIARCQGVKEQLEAFDSVSFHVFSFAISNDADKQIFFNEIQPTLEKVLNISFGLVPSVEEITKEVIRFTKTRFEPWELPSVWGKPRSFSDFCNSRKLSGLNVLIDDVVPNQVAFSLDSDVHVATVNVTNKKLAQFIKSIGELHDIHNHNNRNNP